MTFYIRDIIHSKWPKHTRMCVSHGKHEIYAREPSIYPRLLRIFLTITGATDHIHLDFVDTIGCLVSTKSSRDPGELDGCFGIDKRH